MKKVIDIRTMKSTNLKIEKDPHTWKAVLARRFLNRDFNWLKKKGLGQEYSHVLVIENSRPTRKFKKNHAWQGIIQNMKSAFDI